MITGQCLCGAVKYEIEGETTPVWFCHCSKCRRANGSAFRSNVACERDQFRWKFGHRHIRVYDQSETYMTHFCVTCGSPVPVDYKPRGMMIIPAGQLDFGFDTPEKLHHIFVDSKACWYEITDELPQYAERAPKLKIQTTRRSS